MRILAATTNENKFRELESGAIQYGIQLVSPREIGEPPEVEETGKTYFDNALIKAQAFSRWAKMPALGDDSGLEVAALGGKPGIHSARYAATDPERIAKLLAELSNAGAEANRSALFRCVLVLYQAEQTILSAEGTLSGKVLFAPRGERGFGYDPIILIDEFQRTLAELEFSEVCARGFRARAAHKLFSQLSVG